MDFVNMYKHYVRINKDNIVIKAFSNAFEEPLETDICILENAPRFCTIEIKENDQFVYKLEDSILVKMTQEELDIYYLSDLKNKKIQEMKILCSSTIYAKWSDVYQKNATEDGINNADALAVELNITRDALTKAVGIWINSADQKSIVKNKASFDCSTLITALNIKKEKHTKYLRKIIESVCVYRLKRLVRDWSNTKEDVINACTNIVELNAISFDDIPNLEE